jgi:hypothetical protein
MTATETAPKANPRLDRIKLVSRVAKYVSLLFLVCSIPGFVLYFSPWSANALQAGIMRALVVTAFEIILWFWYWQLSRLFNFYEHGIIFSAEPIGCIKTLGILWVAGTLLLTGLHYLPVPAREAAGTPEPASATPATPPPGVTTVKLPLHATVRHYAIRMGFFSFNFGTRVDFGPLLGGAIIILAAWIMDEGRKMREEQELTV